MKKSLLLIFLICLLVALYFYLEKPKTAFLTLNLFDRAKLITIIKDGSTIKIEKKDDLKIIKPIYSLVSKDFAAKLKQELDQLKPDSVVEKVDSKQEIYGLSPPSMVLILEGDFGREVLSFGKYADFALARYMQRENDEKIYLIKEEFFKLLNTDLNNIRTINPIEFDLDNLQSIAAIRTNVPSMVIKNNAGQWILESAGVSFEVDVEQFKFSAKKLSELEAINFYEDSNLEFYGLSKPILTLRVLLNGNKDSKFVDLIFGKGSGENPFYFMKELGNMSIFQIHRGAFSDWLKELDFYRSKKLFDKLETQEYKKEEVDKLNQIKALGVMNISAFEEGDEKFSLKIADKNIEIGKKLPGNDSADAPSFVKVNNYTLVLSAKDVEFLKSLSKNVQ